MCNYTKTRLRVLKNRRGLTSEEFEARLRRHFKLYMWPRLCVQMFFARRRPAMQVALPRFARHFLDEGRASRILRSIAAEKHIPPEQVSIVERTKYRDVKAISFTYPVLVIKLV